MVLWLTVKQWIPLGLKLIMYFNICQQSESNSLDIGGSDYWKSCMYFRAFITFPSIISIGVSSGERSVNWCALSVSLSELKWNASWASCSERKKTTLTDPQNAGCVHQTEQQEKKQNKTKLKMSEVGRELWRWSDLNPPAQAGSHRTVLCPCRFSISPEKVTPQHLWSVNRFRDK